VKKISKKAKWLKPYLLIDIKRSNIDNPIKSKMFERRYGVGGATVREAIHDLRVKDKEPICSDANGYFFPRDKFEISHTIAQLRSRVREINEVANSIEEYFTRESQQGLGI